MKLKLFDRVMLTLILLLTIALCVGLIVVTWYGPLIQTQFVFGITTFLNSLAYRIPLIVCLVLIIFLCLRILFVRNRDKTPADPFRDKGILIRSGQNGNSFIAMDAMQEMMLKQVRGNAKVRNCFGDILVEEQDISIILTVSLLPDTNIPQATTEIQDTLKEHIETLTGITVRRVEVTVQSMEPEAPVAIEPRRNRVR